MDTNRLLLVAVIAVAASGCQTTAGNSKQATMSLEEAICTVQNALLRTKRPKETQAGLKPSEAMVSLNIGFKEVKSAELGAKLKLGIVEWGPKGSYSRENTSGNVLQIKFAPSDDGPYFYSADKSKMQFKTGDGEVEDVQLPDCSKYREEWLKQ